MALYKCCYYYYYYYYYKTSNGPRVCEICSAVGEEKVYGGDDFPKSQVLISQWKTERVRENKAGDSEDGKMPCVIGETEATIVKKHRGDPRSSFCLKTVANDHYDRSSADKHVVG